MAEQTALDRLAEMGSGFPNLFGARAHTEASLESKRRELAAFGDDTDLAVIMFGSWGRGELSRGSDDDWALLVEGSPREGIEGRVSELEGHVGGAERKPGAQGVFGDVTRLAEELEGGLLTLLFDTDLQVQVRDFGIF